MDPDRAELDRIYAEHQAREVMLDWVRGPDAAAPSPWHARFDRAVVDVARQLAGLGDKPIHIRRREPLSGPHGQGVLGFVFAALAPDLLFLVEVPRLLDPARRCGTICHELRHLAVGAPSETFSRERLEEDCREFSERVRPTVLSQALAAVGPPPF